jgi:hypothetical protein
MVAGGADPTSTAVQYTAMVHGYHVAYVWGAVAFALALLVAVFVIDARRDELPAEGAVVA